MVGEVVPEIRFEQVIWDHNFATTGAAFFINGRPETMSAISLVVDGCLFFRNFMDHTGAFRVNNVWPLTAVITDSDLFEVRQSGAAQLCGVCYVTQGVWCVHLHARVYVCCRLLDSMPPSPSTGGYQ
eukprot:COSAG06_NODE_1724_length_8585_cov_2.178765_4_plen_127_part_00